jgi:hypothetical protein
MSSHARMIQSALKGYSCGAEVRLQQATTASIPYLVRFQRRGLLHECLFLDGRVNIHAQFIPIVTTTGFFLK